MTKKFQKSYFVTVCIRYESFMYIAFGIPDCEVYRVQEYYTKPSQW